MKKVKILLLLLSLLCGCKEYVEHQLSTKERKRVEAATLKSHPTPQISLNIAVEDQVKLLGLDKSRETVRAGDDLEVTFYMEALHRQMEDNRIFIHFHCPGVRNFQNLDGQSITHRLLPLRKFKFGTVVRDKIRINVGRNCKSGKATLYWGLFRGADRLAFRNATPNQVSHDGRLKVLTINVEAAPPRTIVAHNAPTPVKLDGLLSEEAWQMAVPIRLNPIGKHDSPFQPTMIKALFDDANLYLGIEATDNDVWSTFRVRDSNTWEQEVVEIFIDANGSKRDYLELQVTPANVVFDAKFERHRSDLEKARAWNMSRLDSAVIVNGSLNARDDTDKGYSIEVQIPIDQVPNGRSAKESGKWRINFFRFDKLKSGRQQASAWSAPPVPDFHHLDSFGELHFK